MHVGINAQLLSFGEGYRNGGVSRYIRFLLTELARKPGEHTYTVFVNGQQVIDHLKSLNIQHPQITFVSAPWPEEKPIQRILWEQMTLPTLVKRLQIDVLHSPVNVLPERLPRTCAGVVTLHDLAFLRFPEVLTRAKRIYHQTFTLRSLRRATRLICVSESTRRDAHELAGIPLEKSHTVYPCIDARFTAEYNEEKIQEFRRAHGLNDGYILYLGTLEPRKNITRVIEAYARLRETEHRKEKLVLAGGKGWLYDAIFAKIRELGLEEDVLFPGYVADEQQVYWYQAASVFVFPSLYEGFGIPVAEALACGTPVVTSNVSSLPEAGADLALCVDPQETEALSRAIMQGLTDQELRTKCRQQASQIYQRFSAQVMVERTLAVYEKAVQRSHSVSLQ